MKLKVKYPEPVSEEKEQKVFLYLVEDDGVVDLRATFGNEIEYRDYIILSIKPDGIKRYACPGDFPVDDSDYIKILR